MMSAVAADFAAYEALEEKQRKMLCAFDRPEQVDALIALTKAYLHTVETLERLKQKMEG